MSFQKEIHLFQDNFIFYWKQVKTVSILTVLDGQVNW
jgi:hypothetical protein